MTAKEGAPPRLVSKVFIRGTVDAVWREITKTDSLQGAVFNGRLHTPGLRKGAPLQMRSADGSRVFILGDVVEWDPPRRFAHTFRFTSHDDPPCRVVYELEPVEGGVEFTLRVEDCPPGTKTGKQMAGGAPFITGNLKTFVETGRLPFGTRVMYALFAVLGFLLPKRTRAENWPMGGGGRAAPECGGRWRWRPTLSAPPPESTTRAPGAPGVSGRAFPGHVNSS